MRNLLKCWRAAFLIGGIWCGNAVWFSLFAATVPTGSGSYTTSLPAGKAGPEHRALNVTANITAPFPTNDWWTSLITLPHHRVYPYPWVMRCDNNSLIMGIPQNYYALPDSVSAGQEDGPRFRQQLKVSGIDGGGTDIAADVPRVDSYGDWTVKVLWQKSGDTSKYFSATFGHGLVYTYFDYSPGITPRIAYPFEWETPQGQIQLLRPDDYTRVAVGSSYSGDHAIIAFVQGSTTCYFGVCAPPDTVFTAINDAGHTVDITYHDGARYLSIAAMAAKEDITSIYEHGYAFVTGSQARWSVDVSRSVVVTTYTVTTELKRQDAGSDKPIIALFPHQWKHALNAAFLPQQFTTLRGTMKLCATGTVTVINDFHGILPSLPNEGNYDHTRLAGYIDQDEAMNLSESTTYEHGKELEKMANLIPIAGQEERFAAKQSLLKKLTDDLADWYTYSPGEPSRYFYYDGYWGGMIGYDTSYYTEKFNDHHFHYGYYIYASAIAALNDRDFLNRYGSMVDLLVRDIASPVRGDSMFPYLRNFDPYEGHSWANGFGDNTSFNGKQETGNDQESSSEAMNAWAGIYLWGLASGNDSYRDLGIWGYVTEYSAIREYYLNIDKDIYPANYDHSLVGILFSGLATFDVWWGLPPGKTEWVHGIQYLPLNASMLYLGYDTTYAAGDYASMIVENYGTEDDWQDTIWKYQSLFDPASAAVKFDASNGSLTFDSGNSKTFTYHWIHNFDAMGPVDTSVYADISSFGVFNKGGTRTYVCFNPSSSSRTVSFYDSARALIGTVTAPPYAMASTSDFATLHTNFWYSGSEVNVSSSTDVSADLSAGPWQLTLSIPAGSFNGNVHIQVSTSAVSTGADHSGLRFAGMGFDIVLDTTSQPVKPVSIVINHANRSLNGLNPALLRLARYDTATGAWRLIASNADAAQASVTAAISHFSQFTLVQAAANDLSGLTVYPNPYRPGTGGLYDRTGGIVFDHLTAGSRVRLYNVAGEEVFVAEDTAGTGRIEWNAVNSGGRNVASGVYVYIVTDPAGRKRTGKAAVIR